MPCSRQRCAGFGARVVEIRQISAYSCRGMNGDSRAHISEHAFGNALDIAGFTLADGRHVSVKDGWKGMPEEQGFLHDVQPPPASSSTPSGAGLQRLSLRSHPRRSDAPRQPAHHLPAGRALGRGGCRAGVAAQSLRITRAAGDGIARGAANSCRSGNKPNGRVNEEDEFEDD